MPDRPADDPQVVGLLRDVWQTVGLDVYVFPYGVLPTKYECGIIQARPLPPIVLNLPPCT